MPFMKGQSANPSGRPKQERAIVETARAAGPRGVEVLVELLEDDDSQDIPLRGGRRTPHACAPLVPPQGLGAQAGQTNGPQDGQGGRDPQSGSDPT